MVYLKGKKFKMFGDFFFFGVSCVQTKANHKNGYPFMVQFVGSEGDVMKHCIPQNMMDDVNCYIIFPQNIMDGMNSCSSQFIITLLHRLMYVLFLDNFYFPNLTHLLVVSHKSLPAIAHVASNH